MNLQQRERFCHITAALVAVCLVGPVAWMILDRSPPIIFESGVVSTLDPSDNDEVIAGQPLVVTWKARQMRAGCDGIVFRTFTDAKGFIHQMAPVPAVHHRAPAGREYRRTVDTPLALLSGPARYQAHQHYWCNIFQQYFWPIKSSTPEVQFIAKQPLDIVKILIPGVIP